MLESRNTHERGMCVTTRRGMNSGREGRVPNTREKIRGENILRLNQEWVIVRVRFLGALRSRAHERKNQRRTKQN